MFFWVLGNVEIDIHLRFFSEFFYIIIIAVEYNNNRRVYTVIWWQQWRWRWRRRRLVLIINRLKYFFFVFLCADHITYPTFDRQIFNAITEAAFLHSLKYIFSVLSFSFMARLLASRSLSLSFSLSLARSPSVSFSLVLHTYIVIFFELWIVFVVVVGY